MTSNAPHLDAIKSAFLDAVHADQLNPAQTFDWVQDTLAGDVGGAGAYPFGIMGPPGPDGEVQFADLIQYFGPRTWFISNLTLVAARQGAFELNNIQVASIQSNSGCDSTGSIVSQAVAFDGWFDDVPFAWRVPSHIVPFEISPTDVRLVRGANIMPTEDRTDEHGVLVPGKRVEKCRSPDLATLVAWAAHAQPPIQKF